MDQVLANHDEKILEMKDNVEAMWQRSQSKRERRSEACGGVTGVSFFGDNIGKLLLLIVYTSFLTLVYRKSC